jgi:rhodanese-related sulfurtransferase
MSDHLQQVKPLQLLARLQNERDLQLIDVREPSEHEQFNIGGRLIPLAEIMEHANSIPKDRDVILYCKMGIRSQIAIQRLQDKFGFTNLINLQGGMEAWKRDVKPGDSTSSI